MYRISTLAALATLASANTGICRDTVCDDCPGTITSAGTGYPACVTYDTAAVLDGAGGGFENNSVNFNIEANDVGCRTIIRSPAGNDFDNCGTARISSAGNQCLGTVLDTTFLVQFCCGTDDCNAAGVTKRGPRGTTNPFEGKSAAGFSSLVLTDGDGKLFKPRSVADPKEVGGADRWDDFVFDLSSPEFRTDGNGPIWVDIKSDRTISVRREATAERAKKANIAPPKTKRASCSYAEEAQGTKTGTQSYKLSSDYCYPSAYSQTNEQSISRTTSFSASVGDPFGIVSASVGFETTEEQSQSYMYEVPSREGYCGFAQWTPYFICSRGTITCDDGTTEAGEVCTAQLVGTSDDQIGGSYDFVATRPI